MKYMIVAGILAAFAASAYGGPMFTLIPVNATTGTPGGVTGWGYDIVNTDLTNFLVLDDSYVTGSLASGTYGTYADYIASQFIVIGPGGNSGLVAFNPGAAGVGEFDFFSFVPTPTTISGAINIDYSLFSQDPNSPTFDPGSFVTSGTVSAPADATMTPEPGSELLLFGVLPLAFAVSRLRRKRLS